MSAAAAVVSAAAATFVACYVPTQVEMARRIGEPQLRAYMHVYADEVPSEQNDNKNMFVYISLKNFGQTPARNIKFYFFIHPERLPPENIISKLQSYKGVYSLGNNQPFGYKIRLHLTAEQYHNLVRAEGQRYIYVSVQYEDVFKSRHYTNACFVLRPQTETAPLTPCEFFNDAD